MQRSLLAVMLAACVGHAWAADGDRLSRQQDEARRQRTELRERITGLQKSIEQRESKRQTADQELKASEAAISTTSRKLAELEEQADQLEASLEKLKTQTLEEEAHLEQARSELAQQLKGQYLSRLSPWTALLSGDDPHAVGRNLAYLGYVSRAQAEAVKQVTASLERLQQLQHDTQAKQADLNDLTEQTQARHAELEQQKAERQTVLKRIEAQLHEQRQQEQHLKEDDAHLGRLIDDLGAAIREQEEKEREAQRRAEEARKQAEREREKARQEQDQARQAEQTRQQEQAQREQQERERREAEQKEAPAPSSAGGGLDKNLPKPVASNTIQGRFGKERPEGGVWRGIVLRADEGSQVKAIASGRVAYVNWLSGFGNIMIVDHGDQYLSVYAYNQSLLKEVGDKVEAGDVIATVGATGGQVEPGLYFEIRHQGKPVNPQLWLAP